MSVTLSVAELTQMVQRKLMHAQLTQSASEIISRIIVGAEVDDTPSHGLLRLPGYISSLSSGWIKPDARPRIADVAAGLAEVDADNGFAQVALQAGRTLLVEKARSQGIAALSIKNSHHFAALYPDVEPFAEQGFIAFAFVNTRSLIVGAPESTKVLGTNPMAFACPRPGRPPMVWDQASSVISRGDALLHARQNLPLPDGAGVDARGQPSNDAAAVLDGGAFMSFGAHKGFSIALMIEILAAAVTGGRFGFQDESAACPGAQTTHGGEFIMLIDPSRLAGDLFLKRIELLFGQLLANGTKRLPGDRRYRARARALVEGVKIPAVIYKTLVTAP